MNLLIVDDEIVTTQVLEEQLDRALLSIDQIYVAYNTSMARDILQKNKVELILCDIEMPKENGIHFLEWVREQKIQTEVIFLTSHEKFEYAYGAVQNGAANYLLKPIDMNKINQALLRVTEKIAWKQKTEEIREYWKIGKRKIVRYFWTRVLLEPGVQKQGLEEEIKQQGIEEEIQEKYCVVILHFASDKMEFGKEKDDNCLVIEEDGKAVGAAWSRIMNDFGHVDDKTPSIAISFFKEYRGHGLGTLLLKSFLELLKNKGYEKVSRPVLER